MSCPSEDTLELAVLERLESKTMDELAAHIAECPGCQVRLDDMRKFVHVIIVAITEYHRPRPGWAARGLARIRLWLW